MSLIHEIELPSGAIFKNPSTRQAEGMGFQTGIEITPEQISAYRELREKPMTGDGTQVSDQQLMASVLEQTGGPVEEFKAFYPNIFSKI